MAEFKIVLSDPKTGRSMQMEVKDADAQSLMGKKIGDVIKGELINKHGFEFQIMGGSSDAGFPMRRDLEGPSKAQILTVIGVGARAQRKGQKQRKTVFGNTIGDKTAQINMKVVKGDKPLVEEKKEEPARAEGEASAEKSTEEKLKEEAKPEEKPKEKPKATEAPKE